MKGRNIKEVKDSCLVVKSVEEKSHQFHHHPLMVFKNWVISFPLMIPHQAGRVGLDHRISSLHYPLKPIYALVHFQPFNTMFDFLFQAKKKILEQKSNFFCKSSLGSSPLIELVDWIVLALHPAHLRHSPPLPTVL